MMSVSQSPASHSAVGTVKSYYPLHTIHCTGPVVFRNQLVRDYACLLDIDDDVVHWSCPTTALGSGQLIHQPDFAVLKNDGQWLIDVVNGDPPPQWVSAAAREAGFSYLAVDQMIIPSVRLKNAKDLLRYGGYEAALSDRIKVLAALDEFGSLSVADCLSAFSARHRVATLASLILHRFITLDLDKIIGPETQIRRKRD